MRKSSFTIKIKLQANIDIICQEEIEAKLPKDMSRQSFDPFQMKMDRYAKSRERTIEYTSIPIEK